MPREKILRPIIVFLFLVGVTTSSGCYSLESIHKRMPNDERVVIAPADGVILRIIPNISENQVPVINDGGKKVTLEELRGYVSDGSTLVVIFMKPHNKHVTLSPIKGEVAMQAYVPGTFNNVFINNGYLENEHNSIVIDGEIRTIVIQIAGFVFRRIQSVVNENDLVERGDKVGHIAFGSAVAIILPRECELNVKVGDRAKVGETIIARY